MIKVQSELLIVPITAQPSEKIYFKDNPVISNGILKGLQIPLAFGEIGRVVTPFPFVTAPPFYETVEIGDFTGRISGFNSFFLTLCDSNGNEIHKNLNLFTFYAILNNGKIFNHFDNKIDLKRCYIQCSGAPYNNLPITKSQGIIFDFIIETKD